MHFSIGSPFLKHTPGDTKCIMLAFKCGAEKYSFIESPFEVRIAF